MNFLDSLPTMNLDGIKPMFPAAPVADKDKPRQLGEDRKTIRRRDKRRHARRAATGRTR